MLECNNRNREVVGAVPHGCLVLGLLLSRHRIPARRVGAEEECHHVSGAVGLILLHNPHPSTPKHQLGLGLQLLI